ncbi:MAG TPA: CDP-diacylglycerol--serine O-phosphatidyltransferase [Gammaproteobacteria bacterium]|nr:CDP-diacylglycerol--serine O-phosphatidyltransferase [Gammaproteobacteria bacterium]
MTNHNISEQRNPGSELPRGIYLLPNLLTTSGLFAGFYAMVAAMRGDFEHAAIAIFIAMLMDGLDGRVARLTNTESAFGAQYDSLADIVSFGLAPSLVVYSWGLISLGKIGWLSAFFYAAGTALRLARFNTQIETQDKRYFQGLPCPAEAGFVAGMVWVAHEYGVPGHRLWDLACIVTLVTGALMVSNLRYYSFKEVDLKGKVPFVTVLAFLILFVFVSIDPPQVLLMGFGLYVFSGPSLALFRWFSAWRKKRTRQ